MDQFSKDILDISASDDTAAQRNAARDSLFLSAKLRVSGKSTAEKVRVRNLSAGGLMAEMPVPLDHDTPVEVEVRGIGWIPGRVAWTAVGRAGIAFDHPVDPMRARKPVGKGRRSRAAKPALSRR